MLCLIRLSIIKLFIIRNEVKNPDSNPNSEGGGVERFPGRNSPGGTPFSLLTRWEFAGRGRGERGGGIFQVGIFYC